MKEERAFKGVWIPADIYLADISHSAKFLWAEINSFTTNEKPCFKSNAGLAQTIGVSDRQIRNLLNELEECGLIKVENSEEGKRYLWTEENFQGGRKFPGGRKKTSGGVEENFRGGRKKTSTYLKQDTNTITDNNYCFVDAEKSASGEGDNPSLNSKKKKEKTHQGGGAEHLHQRMVEVWDNHLKERFQTSVSGLSKLGGVPANMAALKRIREYLYQSAIDRGLPTPDGSTVKGFEYILQNKHKAGQFYDRAELTHTAKYLPDIIKELNNPTQSKNGNKSTDIITPEQAQQSFERYWRKKYGYTGSED